MGENVDKHRRMINLDFQNALSSGVLSSVTELVKDHRNELLIAFRNDYINIYYLGHSLYKIEQQKTGYKISFNFNHARYTKDYANSLKKLRDLGMRLPSSREKVEYDDIILKDEKWRSTSRNNTITIKISNNGTNKNFWDQSCKLLMGIIDDFYDPEKKEDNFKDHAYYHKREEKGLLALDTKRDKNPLLEKQRQQSIELANNATDNGYFVYDMEYAQPNEKQGDKKSGRFDMLALKIENHKATQLLFIELKSTLSACEGASGIEKHKNDMLDYIERKDVIKVRKKDAKDIIGAYNKLFQIGTVEFSDEFNSKDPGFAIVLTDEAQHYSGSYEDLCNKLDNPWIMKGLKTIL